MGGSGVQEGVADSQCKTWKGAGAEDFGISKECCFSPRPRGPDAGFRGGVSAGWGGDGRQAPSLGASCLGEPGEGESRGEESKRQGERQGPATTRPCDLTQFSALLGR